MTKNFYTFLKTFLLSFFVLAGQMVSAQTTLYDEGVSGDLPNVSAGPVLTVSAAGTYVVKGTLATTADGQDRFQLSISSGYQITGISYSISGGSFINGQINVGGIASASGGGGSVSMSPYSSLPAGTYATLLGVDFSTGSTWSATFTVTTAPTPPSVSSQPSNKTACSGTTATFTSTATGSPTPTVQWQESPDGGTTWNDIAGATNTTLSITATTAKNGYQYGATFTNSGGTDYSNAATLTVISTPSITTNPSNQTVTAGSSATFTAAASGLPTVQWQVSTDGGATYTDVSGATSNTLTFSTTSAQNGNKYRAVYTNSCGNATTTAATLTVNGTPIVTTNPTSNTFCSGATATFTAAASGSPSPTVQWQVSTDGGATYNNISGATSTTLSFTAATSQDNNKYRAVFTNSNGTATTTAGTITVNIAPSITTNPGTQTVCSGITASFTAAASGTPAPTVQWQVSTDGGATFSNVSGATTATLSFAAIATQNNNQYRAVFTNSCGTATSTATTLTVNTAPSITTNPTSNSFCPGASTSFTAAANGSPAPTVQWQLSTDGGATYNNISGATSSTLTFTNTGAENGYKYRAVYTNTCGTATTTAATLSMNAVPVVSTNPSTQTICSGSNVSFTAAASGTPAPTVQWQLSTDGGATFNNISGATSAALIFATAASQNGYQYRAVFTNTCNTATTSAATLNINIAPSVTTNPSDGTFCPGTSTSFTAAASGTPAPTVQWQVSTDGGATYNNISGATANTYSFTNGGTENGYKYRAVYTNTCGTVTATAATLTLNVVPAVTTNPTTQTICAGTTVNFTAAASGTPVPTMQWQVSTDGGTTFNNIAGATAATLSFATAVSDNGNQYRAVFTNLCNTATTTAATLNITTSPVVTGNPSSLTSCAGTTASFTASATATPTPTVQWQVSTDGGATFNNISGATSATLSFTSATAQNSNQYRAVFTNSCGTATTTAATITVNAATVVTTDPSDLTICENATAGFFAAAGGIPTPTVQWQLSTDNGITYADISGATSTTLLFTTVASQSGYKYRAVFTNSCGTATTNAATLSVNTKPVVATNPNATTVCAGSNASFTASANSIPMPTVQWQVSTDGGTTFSNVAGATSTTLTFASLVSQSGNQYRAVFTNVCGTVTTTAAVITVNSLPAITVNPSNTTVCTGTSTSLTAAATGTGISYQWQVNNGSGFVNIPALPYYSGATSPILTITNTPTSLNGYQYRCVVTGTCSPTASTSAATLTVNTLPAITAAPINDTVCAGNNASFTIAGTGTALTYQWQVDDGTGAVNITNGGVYSGATTPTLAITGAPVTMNMYAYRCVISGACSPSVTSALAVLRVNSLPAVTANPASVTLCEGAAATFSINATGTAIAYQWQVDNGTGFVNIAPAPNYHGINTSSLSLTTSTASMNGYKYRCVVSGVCTPVAISAVAVLTVNTLPAVTSQPSNMTICEGNNATFTIAGTGTGITYQWQADNGSGPVNLTNGSLYSGVNTPTLTVTNPSVSMTLTSYRCVVSGTCMPPAASGFAVLRINSIPRLTTDLTSATGCENGGATFLVNASGTNIVYQWQVNDGTGFTNVPATATYSGSNIRVLTVRNISKAMAGYQYRCIISGTCAPIIYSSVGTLSVDTLPVVTLDPVSATICEGNSTSFTAAGTGTTIRYAWQVNTGAGFSNLANSSQYSGVNTPTLTVSNTTAAMNGYQYRCLVLGACNPAAASAAATLTINTAPNITVQPANTTVCNTASITIPLVATGTGLTYQWQVNTGSGFTDLTNTAPYSGVTTNTLAITNAAMSMNNYSYRCIITGVCTPPAISRAAILTVTNTSAWTGAVDTKWSNPANWGCGIIPIATTNVYIPNVANKPVVDISNAICDSISIDNSSSLTFSSAASSLEIKGAFLNAGGFDPTAGSITFSGDQAQVIPAATYNDLHIASSANKTVAGNVMVNDMLDLSNGILVLNNNNITIGSAATISGGSATSYILTNGNGVVKVKDVGAGTLKTGVVTVPIGADNSYTPLSFQNTGAIDNFNVSVITKVYNNYGYTFDPYGPAITTDAVNKTWYLSEDVAGGSNVNISLQWNATDELANFNRHACYASPYVMPNWLPATNIVDVDNTNGSGPYTASMANVTTFPIFGVGSPFVGSTTYTLRGGTVTVFPNPVSGTVTNVKFDVAPSNNVNIYIVDLFGTNFFSAHVNPYDYAGGIIPLDITSLNAGEYILKVVDVGSNNETRTTRFIKL